MPSGTAGWPNNGAPISLRIGIVGLGYTGRRHVSAYERLPDTDVVAVVSRTFEAPGCRRYDSVAAMLAAERLDALSICTPTHLHHPHALAAARAGVPTLLEKPMAATLEEAREILRSFTDSSTLLMLGHTWMHYGSFLELLAAAQAKRLGAVTGIEVQKRGSDISPKHMGDDSAEPVLSARDRIYDDLIHMVCMVDALLAGRVLLQCRTARLDGERYHEQLDAELTFVGGIPVTVRFDCHPARPLLKQVRVVCEAGEFVWQHTAEGEELIARVGDVQRQVPFYINGDFDNTIAIFVECLRTGQRPPADGANGLRTMQIAQAIVDAPPGPG